MNNDPFKQHAPREEDANFRALVGCGPSVVLALWNKLVAADVVPNGGTLQHMMWTFMYAKTYGKWRTMRKLTQTGPKTLRKWINLFWNAVSLVESDVVSHHCRNLVFLITIISKHSSMVCSWHRLFGRIDSKMIDRTTTALFL
jgi:hypothetical protein